VRAGAGVAVTAAVSGAAVRLTALEQRDETGMLSDQSDWQREGHGTLTWVQEQPWLTSWVEPCIVSIGERVVVWWSRGVVGCGEFVLIN
jgi:hypothetical protein